MKTRFYLLHGMLVLVMLLLAACGGQATQAPSISESAITFTADSTTLSPGECTMLRWDAPGAFGVTLVGQGLPASGEMEVCPAETTTYILAIDMGDQMAQRELEIVVTGQPVTPSASAEPTTPGTPADEPTPTAEPTTPGTPASEPSQTPILTEGTTSTPGDSYQGYIIDAHGHLIHQEGQTYDEAADELVREMDENGVSAMFVYGLSKYGGEEDRAILEQCQRYPDRLYPFLSGFDPSDPASVDYVRQQLDTGEWAGLGEVYVRHSIRPVAIPADDPTLMAIFALAGQYGVPVAIHFEPNYGTDQTSGEAELERAITGNPNTTFILLHYGGHGYATPERLDAHPNIYVVYEVGYGVSGGDVEFEMQYLDRVLVGTDYLPPPDLVYSDWVNPLREALGLLSLEQAGLVGYENVDKVLDTD